MSQLDKCKTCVNYFKRRKDMCLDDKIQEYENVAIEALEKQIPKKPYDGSKIKMTWYSKCLTCNKELPYVVRHESLEYCPNCGQRLDWT